MFKPIWIFPCPSKYGHFIKLPTIFIVLMGVGVLAVTGGPVLMGLAAVDRLKSEGGEGGLDGLVALINCKLVQHAWL